MKFLLVKVPKNNEYTYEQCQALLSSLISRIPKRGVLSMFSKQDPIYYSLNVISIQQRIYFVIGALEDDFTHMKNQLLAQYGKADLVEIDSINDIEQFNVEELDHVELSLTNLSYFPIQTINNFQDVDPMASLLSAISRSPDPNAIFWIQIIISPTDNAWQRQASSKITKMSSAESVSQNTQTQIGLIQEKIKHYGFKTNIRLLSNNEHNTQLLKNSFSVYSMPGGNSFSASKPNFMKSSKLLEAIIQHKPYGKTYTLNTLELATVWHLPSGQIDIPNIAWGKHLRLDPPENLPIAYEGISDEEKKNLTFIGKTEYKNQERIFGIKAKDRLRHTYIVGKTGSGKSWLVVNMAIEDIRKGAGVALLDPHGDAIDTILQYIPKSRINDVCYFNPADREYTYPLNILEVSNEYQKELVVSGIVGIFHKLYAHSWGPRLEHILRNVLFTLVQVEGTTLPDIMKILHNKKYRNKLLEEINDPIIQQFWKKEFDGMSERFANEAVAPILNKVGQFVTSPLIRNIIQHPRSKVVIEDLMNSKKIFLCDLSQGKLGEDNATLLGSMIITQIQISAMNRAFIPEELRVPFYLYVDEFQNFATSSFTKILSEARKYKLGLTLANQYITQIDEDIMGAILGNVGSLTSFNVGAQDSLLLHKEFGSDIEAEDLTTMEKYQMITRITVDNAMSPSFMSSSLTLPKNVSGHRDKIIEQSRKRYGLKIKPKIQTGSFNKNSQDQQYSNTEQKQPNAQKQNSNQQKQQGNQKQKQRQNEQNRSGQINQTSTQNRNNNQKQLQNNQNQRTQGDNAQNQGQQNRSNQINQEQNNG